MAARELAAMFQLPLHHQHEMARVAYRNHVRCAELHAFGGGDGMLVARHHDDRYPGGLAGEPGQQLSELRQRGVAQHHIGFRQAAYTTRLTRSSMLISMRVAIPASLRRESKPCAAFSVRSAISRRRGACGGSCADISFLEATFPVIGRQRPGARLGLVDWPW